MIRGSFMDIPSQRGRDGTRIPESGLAAHTSSSDSASESVGTEVSDGAGVIGDSIGVADTQCSTMAGITPGAERFITGAISPEEARAADLMVAAAESTVHAAQPPGRSTETGRRHEAMLHPAVRAASARAPTAATTMADRPGAIRRAEAPAWAVVVERAVAEGVAAAVADVTRLSAVMFLVV